MGHPSACIVEHNISHCTPAPKVTGSPIQIVLRFRTQHLILQSPISFAPLLVLLSLCVWTCLVVALSLNYQVPPPFCRAARLVTLRAWGARFARPSCFVSSSLIVAVSLPLLYWLFPSVLLLLFASFLVIRISYLMCVYIYIYMYICIVVSPITCIFDTMYRFFLRFLILVFASSLRLFICPSHLCSHLLVCFLIFLFFCFGTSCVLPIFFCSSSLVFLLNDHLPFSSSCMFVVA